MKTFAKRRKNLIRKIRNKNKEENFKIENLETSEKKWKD